MKTMLLDPATWDLMLDASGNLALASDPYSQAQDAASAIKLFRGELYYDTTKGVPYYQSILGKIPNISFMKAQFEAAALTVPGVVTAQCFITNFQNRQIAGQVQIRNKAGQLATARFARTL